MNLYIKKNNPIIKRILIGIAILFIFIVSLNLFEKQIRNSFYSIFSPITEVFNGAGKNISFSFSSFFNAKNLNQENNNLKEENQKILSENSLLQDLLRRNQASENILDMAKGSNFQVIQVQTIGLDSTNDFIAIDKGSEDGILENMPVISSQRVLYGKVSKVYNNFSQVMLISNKDNVLDVKIYPDQEKSPIYGAVKGRGNLSIYLDLVNSESEIKEGDVLATSALEGIFPKNILVGKIVSKNKNDLKPFQTAEIQPFFDIKNIENLFVITNYKR